jgi:hypothetical protein
MPFSMVVGALFRHACALGLIGIQSREWGEEKC